MRSFLLLSLWGAMTMAAAGCGGGDSMTGTPDTGVDAGARPDAAMDAGRDVGPPIEEDRPGLDAGQDTGTPIADTGIDAPTPIADTGTDAPTPTTDAGTDAFVSLPDTGIDAGGCASDADCVGVDFCEFPAGTCGGTGTCTPRGVGRLCNTLCNPQCGCDGATYQNECHRHQAGTSLASDGACPGDPSPCGATCGCTTSADCPGTNKECVQTRTGGVCEDVVARPMCWQDSDCANGRTCNGANVCGCGMLCIIADRPGTCG